MPLLFGGRGYGVTGVQIARPAHHWQAHGLRHQLVSGHPAHTAHREAGGRLNPHTSSQRTCTSTRVMTRGLASIMPHMVSASGSSRIVSCRAQHSTDQQHETPSTSAETSRCCQKDGKA